MDPTLHAHLTRHLATEPTAGIAAAVTDRTHTLGIGAFGHANLEAQTPLTPDHLIQIGSIGKMFTALALMQLYEAGRFDPQAPIIEYLPWLEISNGCETVTGHHLLTHTAGLPTGTDEAITAHAEAWILRELPAGPPGVHFHYSNTGYKVLGLVLEALTGQPYARTVREKILEPLGMHATAAAISNADRARYAVGYLPFPDDRPFPRPFLDKTRLAPVPWIETDTGDGCLASTPGDMAVFARALLNEFAPFITSATFRLMTTPHIVVGEGAYGYGIDLDAAHNRIGHGGSMLGHFAYLLCDPAAGFGAVVLVNGPSRLYPLAGRILDHLGDKSFAEEPAPALEAYPGEYRGPQGTIALYQEGKTLRFRGVGIPLAGRAPDIFFLDHPAWDRYFLRGRRDDRGSVEAILYGDAVYYRKGQPSASPPPEGWRAYPGRYRTHNPWYPNFQVLLRENRLILLDAFQNEQPLTELEPGVFRVGEPQSPERVSFERLIAGRAHRMVYSGASYSRTS